MRKIRFSVTQIMGILGQAEVGMAVADLCREGNPTMRCFNILEHFACCRELGTLAGEGLEAAHDDVAVNRIELDQACHAAGFLGSNQC